MSPGVGRLDGTPAIKIGAGGDIAWGEGLGAWWVGGISKGFEAELGNAGIWAVPWGQLHMRLHVTHRG